MPADKAIEEAKKVQKLKPKLSRPLFKPDPERGKAKADAKLLDGALATSALSAVNRHFSAEDRAKAESDRYDTNIATFLVAMVRLTKLLNKERDKPDEEKTHGPQLRAAKGIIADAALTLSAFARVLEGWEKARSDIVKALAAAKKALKKKADEAAAAGTPKARKEYEAAVKAEATLRVWAFEQGKKIEAAKKQLQERRRIVSDIVDGLATIPASPGTAI